MWWVYNISWKKIKMNTDIILTFFESNLYLFLLIIPFLSQLGLPIWAMFFIMFAWALVHDLFELTLLFSLVLISTVSWDLLSYFIWKKFFKFKKIQNLLNKKLIRNIYKESKKYFKKRWVISIFLSRFLITWVWPTINYIVWMQFFSFKKFSLYVILWEMLYSSELLLLWYIFKDTFEEIYRILSNFWLIVLSAFVLYEIWKHLFRKKSI